MPNDIQYLKSGTVPKSWFSWLLLHMDPPLSYLLVSVSHPSISTLNSLPTGLHRSRLNQYRRGLHRGVSDPFPDTAVWCRRFLAMRAGSGVKKLQPLEENSNSWTLEFWDLFEMVRFIKLFLIFFLIFFLEDSNSRLIDCVSLVRFPIGSTPFTYSQCKIQHTSCDRKNTKDQLPLLPKGCCLVASYFGNWCQTRKACCATFFPIKKSLDPQMIRKVFDSAKYSKLNIYSPTILRS